MTPTGIWMDDAKNGISSLGSVLEIFSIVFFGDRVTYLDVAPSQQADTKTCNCHVALSQVRMDISTCGVLWASCTQELCQVNNVRVLRSGLLSLITHYSRRENYLST
jgi:hypothetical protein